MRTGNHMIDADLGNSPQSPRYKGFRNKCEHCKGGCDRLIEVEYVKALDEEDAVTDKMWVCDNCLWDLRHNKNYVLI